MTKRNKIIYWVSTLWLSLGMVSTGLVQLLHSKEEVEPILRMGYPEFFLTLLGVWKLLGVIAVLVPKLPLIKEWAYAGFFFAMSGAIFSHVAFGNPIRDLFPASLLLILTVISWYFRPAERKIVVSENPNS
ncbi:DoxX family protein [Leptospira gomenensis]|uniref:DoxX family protein n=1 Tax=Leptospira gomenensis TaxID=2484974 RepID=A0A5F1YAS8_9LEPT|nr:DoxX family protein [Leptospira gomenensis]TGK33825.1 DoxX family protein [Leptospira gomenensis]TGK42982.1 DoxX family protein [Leptospira gomenensis]TGK44955.1 DoxX family protein [Leptospira gomenensis]TGK59901.1 DoxX family protein [Leptospira gomenensis]